MKRTGKLFVFLMSMALITNSGCAKTSQKEMIISADYPFYDTVEDAKNAAMEIVEVKVISSESVTLDANESLTDEQTNDSERNPGGETDRQSLPYTIYTVEVMQVYKGAVTVGNTIEMKQLGGTIDRVHYVQEDAMTIEIGNTYIMFLETYENSPASLINPIQGIYEYKDGKITGSSKNTWVLTLEDMKE